MVADGGAGSLDAAMDSPALATPDAAVDRSGAPGSCGSIGQACCGSSPACGAGAVCLPTSVPPRCAACGGDNQLCCAGSTCNNGACCLYDRCVPQGQACVFGASSYGLCQGGQCACGREGQPCCPSTSADVAGRCASADLFCQATDHLCRKCGAKDGACCPGRQCTEAHTTCAGSPEKCWHCGGPGEPCCAGNQCDSTTELCTGGLCETCGGERQYCCAGDRCANGGCCAGNLCWSQGAQCEDFTTVTGVCQSGTCACGGDEQPCCTGATPCTAANTQCTATPGQYDALCRKCGVPGSPCCPGQICQGGCCVETMLGGSICAAASASCGPTTVATTCASSGSCGPCGGLGQACCTSYGDSWCSAGHTACDTKGTHKCVSCGDNGQPCCGSPFARGACNGSFTCQSEGLDYVCR